MTRHRQALPLRAGVLASLMAGALIGVSFGLASPAYADDKVGVGIGPDNFELRPGESREFQVDVENKTDAQHQYSLEVQVPGEVSGDVVVAGRAAPCTAATCTIEVGPKSTKSFRFTISAKAQVNVAAGQTKGGGARVTVQGFGGGAGTDDDQFQVRVRGADQAPTVPEVAGTVTDATSKQPVKDAIVTLRDGAGVNHDTGTDGAGKFRFTASDNIAAGELLIGAQKDTYTPVPLKITGRPGQALTNLKVALKASGAPSPSVEPTPSDPGTTAESPAVEQTVQPAAAQPNTSRAAGSGTSSFSTILIILGGLLVLLGIGAIILLMRRRGDDPEESEDDPAVAPRGPLPGPASPGVYGASNAPTVVAGSAMGAPAAGARMGGMNDATAFVPPIRPAEDPYATQAGQDPYPASTRAYAPTSGGYAGQPGAGYAPPPPAGYAGAQHGTGQHGYADRAGYGGTPNANGYPAEPYGTNGYQANGYQANGYQTNGSQPNGYSNGSHSAAPKYGDEPEEVDAGEYGWHPSPNDRGGAPGGTTQYRAADEPTGRYQPGPADYPDESTGGYDNRGYSRGPNGYEEPPATYGSTAPGGYQPSGYDPAPEQRTPYDAGRGGYSAGDHHYEQSPSAPAAPRQAPPPPAAPAPPAGRGGPDGTTRRSLDWLDD